MRPAPLSPDDAGVRVFTERPLDAGRGRAGAQAAAVDAVEVAPGAEGNEVLRRVVDAVGAEAQRVRGDVATGADGARAAVAVALVDGGVLDTARQCVLPRRDERLAREAQKSGSADVEAPVLAFEPPVVTAEARADSKPQRDAAARGRVRVAACGSLADQLGEQRRQLAFALRRPVAERFAADDP